MHPGGIGAIPELGMKEYSYAENQEYMETYTYPMISELLNRYHPVYSDGTLLTPMKICHTL